MGIICQERKEKEGSQVESTKLQEPRRVGHVVHAGSSDISGRGEEEHDRDERPAWMVRLAGGRF